MVRTEDKEPPFKEEWWVFLIRLKVFSRREVSRTVCDWQPQCRDILHSCMELERYPGILKENTELKDLENLTGEVEEAGECPLFMLQIVAAKNMAKELTEGRGDPNVLQDLAQLAKSMGAGAHPAVAAMRVLQSQLS